MNKVLEIQRSKTVSSYGGVGSNIETIDNVALLIRPFEEWEIYKRINESNNPIVDRLKFREDRLISRLRNLGFENLKSFFQPENFSEDQSEIVNYAPRAEQTNRMITSQFFPRWFYCPRCNRFHTIEKWEEKWNEKYPSDKLFTKNPPACYHCSKRSGRGLSRPRLQQIRFVMASMETGEIKDIPWSKITQKRGKSDEKTASVWNINDSFPENDELKFYMAQGSAELQGLSVSDGKNSVTMAEVMLRYIVESKDGKQIVYQPVIRSANNVYFNYNLSSLFIPKREIPFKAIERIRKYYEKGHLDDYIEDLKEDFGLTEKEIKDVIDSGFQPSSSLNYENEDSFRRDEFDFITDKRNYIEGIYQHEKDELISEEYVWPDKPHFISGIFFQRRLKVTTVQVAYSRIDKISQNYLSDWAGKSENPKQWYNIETKKVDKETKVKLHPTCNIPIREIEYMPAVTSYGEGFFIQLDLSSIPSEDRHIFLHTFCHLILKELEFTCGYSLASLSEKLYSLPKDPADPDSFDRYGFLIFSANGEEGSYGGITSLFYSDKIRTLIKQAILLAQDCPNDPICEKEKGHCFACLDIPETTCELFNNKLDRNIINKYCK